MGEESGRDENRLVAGGDAAVIRASDGDRETAAARLERAPASAVEESSRSDSGSSASAWTGPMPRVPAANWPRSPPTCRPQIRCAGRAGCAG